MAARQVLGSIRLPLAPRGKAMDGGVTAKSEVTMTKDFKAYVQHLQDDKFNSRNIACNGMRRLIASHSKSATSYTSDEMITLLKTVEKPILNVLQNEKHTIVIKSVCLLIEAFVNLKLTLHDDSTARVFQSFIPKLLKLSVSETVGFSNPSKSCLARIAKYVDFDATMVLNIYVKAVRNEALRCGCFGLLQQKMCKWQNDNQSIIPSEDLGVLMVMIPMAIADQHANIRSKCFALFMTVFESWKQEATLIFDNLKPKSKIFLLRDSEKLQAVFPWPRKTVSSTPSEAGSTTSRLSSKRREALNAWVNEREKQRRQQLSDLSSSKKAPSSASNKTKTSVTRSGNRISTSKAQTSKKERKSKRQLKFDSNDENSSIESNANFFITRDLKQKQVDLCNGTSKATISHTDPETTETLFNSIESECRDVFEKQISRHEFSKIDDTMANNEWTSKINDTIEKEAEEQQENTAIKDMALIPAVHLDQESTQASEKKEEKGACLQQKCNTPTNVDDSAVVIEDMYSSVVLDTPVELNESRSSPEDTLQKQLEEMQKDIEEMTKTQNEAEQAMSVSLLSAKKNKLVISPSVDFSIVQRDLRLLKKKKSSSSSSSLKDQAAISSSITSVNDEENDLNLSAGRKGEKEEIAICSLKSDSCNTTTNHLQSMEDNTPPLSMKQEVIPVPIDSTGNNGVVERNDAVERDAFDKQQNLSTKNHDIDDGNNVIFANTPENKNTSIDAAEEVDKQIYLEKITVEEKAEAASEDLSTLENDCTEQNNLEQEEFNSSLQQIDVESELEAFFKLVENDKEEALQDSQSNTKKHFASKHFSGNMVVLLLSFAALIAFSMHLSSSKFNTGKPNLIASSKPLLMLPLPQTSKKSETFSSSSNCFPVITTEKDEREGRNLCYDPVLQLFKDVSFNKANRRDEENSPKIHVTESIKLEPVPVLHLRNQHIFSKQNQLRTVPFVYADVETTYLIDDKHYVDLTNEDPISYPPKQSPINNETNEDNKGLSPLMIAAAALISSTLLIAGIASIGEENIVKTFCKQANTSSYVSTESYFFDEDMLVAQEMDIQNQNHDVSSETKLNSDDIFNAVHVKLDKQTGRVATLTPVRRSKRVQEKKLSLKKQESFDIQVNRNELEEILFQGISR